MNEVRRLLAMCRPVRKQIALGVLLSVVVILSNVALMATSGWFITSMALAGLGKVVVEFFTPAAAIRGLALLRSGARYLERLVSHDATMHLLARLRPWFYERLVPLAPARLKGLRNGDLLARVRSDIDALDNFHLRILGPVLAAAISSVVVLICFAAFSPVTALIVLIGLLLAGVVVPFVVRRLTLGTGARLVRQRSALQAGSGDLTRGFDELRILGATAAQTRALGETSKKLIAAQRTPAWISAAGVAMSGLVGQAMVLVTVLFLLPAVDSHAMTGPIFAMLILAVMSSTEAVSALPTAFAAWDETMNAARRIFELADRTPAVEEPAAPEMPKGNSIAFRDVSFSYGAGSPPVLSHFDLTVSEGECLALTGPSGVGKTTILTLLQRFRDPQEGVVELGGTDLRKVSDDTLRQHVSVVDQQTHLFNATLAENLRMANPKASDDDLWRALEDARLADEVHDMPQALDTRLGELGARLSGGQARRVAIARALLADAPILLLDEPTEGLDARTEAQVIDALGRLIKGRTVILVTHRPAALALADRQIRVGKA